MKLPIPKSINRKDFEMECKMSPNDILLKLNWDLIRDGRDTISKFKFLDFKKAFAFMTAIALIKLVTILNGIMFTIKL